MYIKNWVLHLPVITECGRYGQTRIDRAKRHCEACHIIDIEDEYHFIIVSTVYLQGY